MLTEPRCKVGDAARERNDCRETFDRLIPCKNARGLAETIDSIASLAKHASDHETVASPLGCARGARETLGLAYVAHDL